MGRSFFYCANTTQNMKQNSIPTNGARTELNSKINYSFSLFTKIVWKVLLPTILFSASAGAQSFSPVNYNFQNQPGQSTTMLVNSNTSFNTLISTWSNGYGTWAVDKGMHWLLLANSLSDENTSETAPVASGIIESGDLHVTNFSSQREVKVAANLAGNVRFVAINHNRDGFIVEGFNDLRAIAPSVNN